MTRRKTESYNTGKLPPQETELESAILGQLILGSNIDETTWQTIKPEIFYETRHQKIFNALYELYKNNSPIDELTITAKLRSLGELELIGGIYYITELIESVKSHGNIEYHIRIVYQKFIQREIIRISTLSIRDAYDDTTDSLELLEGLKTELNQIQHGISSSAEKDTIELALELDAELERVTGADLLGLSTGFKSVDKILKGDQDGDVRIIAASTGMGKTALECSEVLNCCFDADKNLLENQIPVVVYNLEMRSVKFSIRLMANLSSIDKDTISFNRFTMQEKQRYEIYKEKFKQAKIFIEDRSELNISQFEASIADLVKKKNIKKAYIDYVQLMKPDPAKKYGTRELELADIGRRIKGCARKHKITIIELLQLNEEVLRAKNCVPNISHIRECKALAHDADNVMFIWRPDYYEHVIGEIGEIDCELFNIKITDFTGVAFLIIAKNREGTLGKIPIKFKGNIMRMYDHPQVLDALQWQKNSMDETVQTAFDIPNNFIIRPPLMGEDNEPPF